jgi:hypothetical protein
MPSPGGVPFVRLHGVEDARLEAVAEFALPPAAAFDAAFSVTKENTDD